MPGKTKTYYTLEKRDSGKFLKSSAKSNIHNKYAIHKNNLS